MRLAAVLLLDRLHRLYPSLPGPMKAIAAVRCDDSATLRWLRDDLLSGGGPLLQPNLPMS